MKPLKFASIDIGSNAIRFLLSYVFELETGPFFRKGILLRVPLRLGEDAFKLGRISIEKEKQMVETMLSFKHLMASQEIVSYKALATSAMRDAINGPLIVDHISKKCGINIEIISGDQEADVISGEKLPDFAKDLNRLLYVDVGGGSTEMTYHVGDEIHRESFNIGTIRYMIDQVEKSEWKRMKSWLKKHDLHKSQVLILGSGGNINKIFKMKRRRSSDMYISTKSLMEFYEETKPLSYTDKIVTYNLNPDRADVIIPAAEIFLHITDLTETKRIYVPKTGLSDGIVRSLYEEYLASKN